MTVRRSLIFLVLLVIAVPIAIGLLAASQNSTTGAESEQLAIPEGFANLQLPDGVQLPDGANPFAAFQAALNVSALGTIEANEVAELSFQVGGELDVIAVVAGDYVEAGTVIAQLDYESAQINYSQALLNLERSQANLRELFEPVDESEIRAAEANIASAQASYSSIANSVTDEDIRAAELSYQQEQLNYNAEVQARTQMSGTEEEIALQEATIGQASFNLEIARLQLEELQTPDSANLWSASTRIEQARLQLEALKEGPTEEEITRLC